MEIAQKVLADTRIEHHQYVVIAGSHAYGTAVEGSDIDIRGWYFPPVAHLIGFPNKSDNCIVYPDEDVVLYTFHKFIHLLTQCNPNVVEQVGVPDNCKLKVTPFAQRVLDNLDLFLSKRVFYTFGGYANTMLKRFEQNDGHRNHKVDELKQWKHLSHLIRLLYMGIDILKCHKVVTYREQELDLLLSIRQGEVSLQRIMELREQLESQLQYAYDQSTLQEQADMDGIQQLTTEMTFEYILSIF